MKKTVFSILLICLLCVAGFTWTQQSRAAEEMGPTPIQKAMKARAAWLKSMTVNLKAMKYEVVGKDATALASQTSMIAQKLTNPEAKELTMKVSTLATELAGAAAKMDGAGSTAKLSEIKATCGQCHAKFRDNK